MHLGDALRRLGARGMTNVLVEGGPTVLSALLRRRLVDEVHVIVASRVVGDAGDPLAPGVFGHDRFTVARRLLGSDMHYTLRRAQPR